jgi:uncharacterized protein (DUF2267 family)
MRYEEFIAEVRRLGEYDSAQRAEEVVDGVLAVLGARLSGGESRDLASQLPGPLQDSVQAAGEKMPSLSSEDFLGEVGKRLEGASAESARWDASAVLTVVASAIDGGQLNHVISQLPTGYAPLFGHPELA